MYENRYHKQLQEAFEAGYRKAMREQMMPSGMNSKRRIMKNKLPHAKPEPDPSLNCPPDATYQTSGWNGAGCYGPDGQFYDFDSERYFSMDEYGNCWWFECWIDENGVHKCGQRQGPCPLT